MKKKLLLVLVPAVLIIAGAFGVWANEQTAQPRCNKCVKAENAQVPAQPGCAKCVKMNAADGNATAPCPNCANCAKAGADCPKTPDCQNCPKNGAEGKAGCDKCAKLKQPAEQPAQKPCCNKDNKFQQL